MKNDKSKCKYVTEEGELLHGTAIIKEASTKYHGRFLEPEVFLHRVTGGSGYTRSFEGC